MKIAVIYYSHTDVTGTLAKSVIKGINDNFPMIGVIDHKICGEEIVAGRFVNKELFENLLGCDAIIMGSPTYMGGVSSQFKAFADASSEYWGDQLWANKVAAGFTSGNALNGDQSSSLGYMVTLANQHGMYWVGLDLAHGYKDHGLNRLGCQLGVVSASFDGNVNRTDELSAHYLGKRVADMVTRLAPKT
ncbi:flavodoxin family protein [Vibrio sp. ZSDZ65]|uniref:Flavodoxin family protein n=1 Tax=Vibrio qingdaonensis TaxID=2829491 RepID=A0A9X3HZ75_9VIBR|nr:flavodoxin family protein [Vibrio qingdaonensis]MCW8349144.1 flavodoxin family protein [Vibrio qingdaonensis]